MDGGRILANGRAVVRATFILGVLNIASRPLGFVREQAIAWRFGAGALVDSYVAAMFVPQLLSGIIGVMLVPFLAIYLEQRDARHGKHVAGTTFLALLIVAFIASIGVLMFPQLIVRVLVGSFSTEQQALTAELLRILSLCIMFGSASAFLTVLFHGHQDFVVPALTAFALT